MKKKRVFHTDLKPISRNFAFTLIELLIVISIIALLAAILFPVFSRARENARRSTCQSNEKQLSLALIQYTQDYDERLPAWTVVNFTGYWHELIQPYVNNYQIVRCPSAIAAKGQALTNGNGNQPTYGMTGLGSSPTRNVMYAYNGMHLSYIKEPARTFLLVETMSSSNYFNGNGYGAAYVRFDNIAVGGTPESNPEFHSDMHFDGSNVAFVDGHVKWIKTGTGKDWIWDLNRQP